MTPVVSRRRDRSRSCFVICPTTVFRVGHEQRPATVRAIVAAGAVAGVIAASCGSGGDTVCVSSDIGRVCADNSGGQIAFSGRGLDPENDVTVENDQVGPIVYGVDADGDLESGASGVLSYVADTEFTFTVYAVDADGAPFVGDIVIRS